MVNMEEQITPELLEEMEALQQEDAENQRQDGLVDDEAWKEAYGATEPEEKQNQHAFLSKALDSESPEKVTFLSQQELGNPHFSVRFLLDLEDISKFYLDEFQEKLGVPNKLAAYFRAKIDNICASGMSNEGFVQNMNISRKIDISRKRVRDESLKNLKGGKG